MDMFADKYKRIEGEPVASINPQAGEMMAFVSVEEPVLEDLSDGKAYVPFLIVFNLMFQFMEAVSVWSIPGIAKLMSWHPCKLITCPVHVE